MPQSKIELATQLSQRERFDEFYSPDVKMVREVQNSPGYHTQIPDGETVHSTRASLNYAVELLETDDEFLHQRAAEVILAVLALQDTDPTSLTYGIWPWLLEEPLEKMVPPDWNWADFCGAQLAEILVHHITKIPALLIPKIQTGLHHAAWSIFRRNVRPNYTNIAIMGAGVCAIAGELLNEPFLLDYARLRLVRLIEHTAGTDAFEEYNSPTYTIVALQECERILRLVKDPKARESAEELRIFTWRGIAGHFHPVTRQWAGPHSRAYADKIGLLLLHTLGERIGVDFASSDLRLKSPTHEFSCPAELIERFRAVPNGEIETRSRFSNDETAILGVFGTTWMNDEATLGTADRDSLWTQRHPLIAYWKSGNEVAVLRLRFLKDGRDFASVGVQNVQQGRRVFSTLEFLPDKGDFHLHLDRPATGFFVAADLRLRYELTAPNAQIRDLGEARFELRADSWRAVIQTVPGHFGTRPIVWEIGQEDGRVFLDAICHRDSRLEFDPVNFGEWKLAAGLELLRTPEESIPF